MLRLIGRLILLLAVAGVLAAAGILYWGYTVYNEPGPLDRPATVVLPRGTGLGGIAERLAQAGVIGLPTHFAAVARLTGVHRSLQAGEYAFAPGVSPREVMDIIAEGRTVVRWLTVPEGLTTVQVLLLIDGMEGLGGAISKVPDEGELLPDTYRYSYGDRRDAVLDRMRHAMDDALGELWPNRAPNLPLKTPEEAVILASIVEKETGLRAERPMVAGVFINRLRQGMRLDSDPTVIYAVSGGQGPLDRPLTRTDLETDHPYNTYRNTGLPPGPIANPGRASLEAVLNPAPTDALYFVADGTGGHAFSTTLDEHNRNVRKWRALNRRPPQ
ncbi:MAG: endolytic transglycosylase MltG [Alphaproteobacteria bacterium]